MIIDSQQLWLPAQRSNQSIFQHILLAEELPTVDSYWRKERQFSLEVFPLTGWPWSIVPTLEEYMGSIHWTQWVIKKKKKEEGSKLQGIWKVKWRGRKWIWSAHIECMYEILKEWKIFLKINHEEYNTLLLLLSLIGNYYITIINNLLDRSRNHVLFCCYILQEKKLVGFPKFHLKIRGQELHYLDKN